MVVSSGPNMYIIKTKKNSKSCILGKMYLKSFSPASCYQQNIVFCVKKLKEDKIPAERGGAWFSNFAPSPSPIDKQNQSLREIGQFSLLFSTFSAVFDLPALAVEENVDFINQSCPPYTTLHSTLHNRRATTIDINRFLKEKLSFFLSVHAVLAHPVLYPLRS